MYGCEYDSYEYDSKAKNAWIRLFPSLMSQKNRWFNFKNWSFKWEKIKEETGRVVCFKEFEIRHSFTLEWTFYGRTYSNNSKQLDEHMDEKDYICVGEDLGRTLINFLPFPKYQRKLNFLYKKFIKIIHEEALKFWLPFNNERYLKRKWKEDNVIEPIQLSLSKMNIPSFEELEGKPFEQEIDNISLSSNGDSSDLNYNEDINWKRL